MRRSVLLVGLLASALGCGTSSNGEAPSSGGAPTGAGGKSATTGGSSSGGALGTGGALAGASSGGTTSTASGGQGLGGAITSGGASTAGTSMGGSLGGGMGAASGGQAVGTGGTTAGAGGGVASGGSVSGGKSGTGGQGGGAQTGGAGGGGGLPSACVGKAWPTADPTKAGPFQVTTEKNVGPLAGVVPDPVYGSKQQRFNVYRPQNISSSGYCHPILIWANGMRDNPEENPPDCIINRNDKWCGQYGPMVKHLASHGFVVVASLSTATADGNPLPTIVGLNWILEQSEVSGTPYYHTLDTANIGQLGHSYGGVATCISASEPRYKALATICGTRALTGVHTPMLFFCGGKDAQVPCAGIKTTFLSVTNQPAFFLNEKEADHGSWVYQGANGVSLSSAAAWFRVHLMNDTANRKYFYGSGCTFCTDNRVEAEQNSLMK